MNKVEEEEDEGLEKKAADWESYKSRPAKDPATPTVPILAKSTRGTAAMADDDERRERTSCVRRLILECCW